MFAMPEDFQSDLGRVESHFCRFAGDRLAGGFGKIDLDNAAARFANEVLGVVRFFRVESARVKRVHHADAMNRSDRLKSGKDSIHADRIHPPSGFSDAAVDLVCGQRTIRLTERANNLNPRRGNSQSGLSQGF